MTAVPTFPSQMAAEVAEIPAAVARLLAAESATIRDLAEAARRLDPAVIATVARGSSDHADRKSVV